MRKRLIGRIRDSNEVTADAATEEINFGGPLLGQFWLIDRVYYNAGSTLTQMTVYVGHRANFNIVDFSTSLKNVADNAKPYYVPAQHDLLFRFTGLTVGDKPLVNIYGRIFDHVPDLEELAGRYGGNEARPQPLGDDVVIDTSEKAQRELADNVYGRRQGR